METVIRKPTLSHSQRIIGRITGSKPGPTLVFFGGIHGNEPAGVTALEQVFKTLQIHQNQLNGTVFGIKGNLKGLAFQKRYIDTDLNRIWHPIAISSVLRRDPQYLNTEEAELLHLYQIIAKILLEESPPYYFIDLHTTSSPTPPFITISDAMINRKFAALFNTPIVLGLEEYLQGTLLNYINHRGYVSLGFEAGQHQAPESVTNCVSFILQSLVYTDVLSNNTYKCIMAKHPSSNTSKKFSFYEVVAHHHFSQGDRFSMLPGYKNFTDIKKGEILATQNGIQILSTSNAKIFMPLYQKQGNDGFFIIKKISPLALKISAAIRKIKLYSLLTLLPGISWTNREKQTLMVNREVARFYIKSIFHLLGYRKYDISDKFFFMRNREKRAKNHLYKDCSWY